MGFSSLSLRQNERWDTIKRVGLAPEGVGNGGLSIRGVAAMGAIARIGHPGSATGRASGAGIDNMMTDMSQGSGGGAEAWSDAAAAVAVSCDTA